MAARKTEYFDPPRRMWTTNPALAYSYTSRVVALDVHSLSPSRVSFTVATKKRSGLFDNTPHLRNYSEGDLLNSEVDAFVQLAQKQRSKVVHTRSLLKQAEADFVATSMTIVERFGPDVLEVALPGQWETPHG